MEKAKELFNSILPVIKEIRKESEEYLKKALDANNGKIDFYDDELGEYKVDGRAICVVYDGGNHPEYASNAFSNVLGVFYGGNGEICVATEDCDEYGLENLSWGEVFDIACYVEEILNEQ